jgi:N-methylhydantoinase B
MDKMASASVDPITLEIIRRGLVAIPNEIDANITRTAFSPLVYEYKDFATGLVDPEGRLVAQGDGSIPIFVANALGNAVRDGLEIYGADDMHPGDIIISNHAGTLGQHLNNVVMYTPVFVGPDETDLFGFMCVLVHWIDIGGGAVGSCSATDTTDIFQEGIQYRTVKLWNRGIRNEELYRIVQYNTRFPEMVLGDLDAQLAGTLSGCDKIKAIVGRYGPDTVRAAIATIWDQSEGVAREAIKALPDGVWKAKSYLDNDGIESGEPVPVEIEVRIDGDSMTIDFSGLGGELRGPLNSGVLGGAYPAARIAFKILTAPDEPANEGCFRPLKIVIPDGTFLSANPTAPMGLYSATLPTVIDTIVRAVGKGSPRAVAGGHHASFSAHWFFGNDPATGELFQQLDTGHGGWGATENADGSGPFKTMAHGDTLDVPVEVQESLNPILIESVGLRPDSAGDGAMRGGLGTEKIVRVLTDCQVSVQIDRTLCTPWGVEGGADGQPGESFAEYQDGEAQRVLKGTISLASGDRFRLKTSGGGGYGKPVDRNAGDVAEDVAAGYITPDRARDVYGVVLDVEGNVNSAATKAARDALR